ncbi:hypothetical protein BBW65_01915 [Helicobacter enhydrae]|uniref:Ribosome maturation factor RimP n=1 Tax=Helicobacter enhydrae TaxID=222136 RepID=A0A1B1U4D0_9HELI|nr:ribosome maturation factor RimP [Helicobacter enhydrae]ANV97637.1 hypothetical protein BBW65_01915 [Helicobacter enhydrae]
MTLSQDLYDTLQTYIQNCDCNLYDIIITKEFNQDVLRIMITSPQGITLDKCQEVSNLISPLLDVQDPFSSPYTLEVSSPGIERILKSPRHFKYSIGETLEVRLLDKSTIIGTLHSSDDEKFTLEIEGNTQTFFYHQTKKVKTFFEW